MASAPDLAPTYAPPGAPQGPHRLIAAHRNLVRKIAWHVHGRARGSVEIDDLVQIGMLALVESAASFVDRGEAAFSTYASLRVKGAMIDHMRRMATIGRGAMQSARRLRETAAELARTLGRDPTSEEMAAHLGLSAGAYRATVDAAAGSRHESLDDVYSEHSMWFAADQPDAFDDAAREELRAALTEQVRELPEREALVLQLYFVEEMNLDEIGAVLDVGAARVCQIKKAALGRLRAGLSGWEA